MQVVVDHCGKQVVGCGNSVEVAGQVQVQLLHGHNLRVATASCATLNTEGGAHGGLTQGEHRLASGLCEALSQ